MGMTERQTDAEQQEKHRQLEESGDRVAALRRKHLPEDGHDEATPPTLKCPVCTSPMEVGAARIRATLWSFLFVGLSIEHLWFRSRGSENEDLFMKSGERRTCHRCTECGTAVLIGNAGTR